MTGFMSVSMMSSWRFRYRPAIKSAASTFSCEFFSLFLKVLSNSSAVDSEMIGCSMLVVGN